MEGGRGETKGGKGERGRGEKEKSVTIKRHFKPPFSGFSAVASSSCS